MVNSVLSCCVTNHVKTQWHPTISIDFFHSPVCALAGTALLPAEGGWDWLQVQAELTFAPQDSIVSLEQQLSETRSSRGKSKKH